ncbi:MAG: hypothetical protein JEZ12_22390 [Desulfobacterium sp.]|nr:hypothetical protein [Desulfobacterium sp.]
MAKKPVRLRYFKKLKNMLPMDIDKKLRNAIFQYPYPWDTTFSALFFSGRPFVCSAYRFFP